MPTNPANKDEIEQIMDEIEQLQKEIDSTDLAPVIPAKPVAARPAPAPEMPNEPMVTQKAPAQLPSAELSNELQELGFGTGGDSESSLEDTLGTLEEEPSSGNGALDEIDVTTHPVADAEEIVEEEIEGLMQATASASVQYDEDASELEEIPMNTTSQMKDTDSSEGTLSMTLKGNMTLKLQYDVDGQVVTVGFADGALKIELVDGTEFKIPVRARRNAGPVRRVA
jgi:hypothetical protein